MAFDNNDPGGADDARQLAIDLLARELHCAPADIVIVELSPVTWPKPGTATSARSPAARKPGARPACPLPSRPTTRAMPA